ncbi:hypothetical protein Tco_0116713 [Tanacetum coccineum]
MLDEEVALKLQAEFDEEERLVREKAEKEKEANIALIEQWDDIQAKINVDYQLAERLQAQEREELFVKEKATLFQQLLKKKEKDRREKKPNHQHKLNKENHEVLYLKIMEGKKAQRLENKSFDSIQKCLTDFQEGEEEVTIDAIPLDVKSPRIKDLETLYKLVKAKYKSTRPVEDLDLVLWNDLKTMFEPHVEDRVWRNQQDYKVLSWKLYDSYGVHFLRMQHVQVYMLVEKRYPLTPPAITNMMNKKLQVDYFSENRISSLKLLTKQLKNQ